MSDTTGVVETQYLKVDKAITLESGKTLKELTIAYEAYGELNSARSNAVLIAHALSGDAHVAGLSTEPDPKLGWWDNMVGPGKAIDTDRYFVICSNVLGGCKGTTGPSSIDPDTGKEYALDFPVITIKDMVDVQDILVEHLGIEVLHCVTGGSMGGMQAIQWIVSYPEKVRSAVIVASALRQSAQNIAFQDVGRQAIMTDPSWNNGRYYETDSKPSIGLGVARMIGHITYLSDESMHEKFGRSLKDTNGFSFAFKPEFEVQNYLEHQGQSFVKRFDANSYLYITKAIDYFDLDYYDAVKAFARSEAEILTISFTSDWLYPPHNLKEIARAARAGGKRASYYEVSSTYGHDGFLLEEEKQTPLYQGFLKGQESRASNA